MLSVLDILILVLCFETTTARPLKQYTNTTSSAIPASTRPQTVDVLHVASAPSESPPQIVTGPTTLIVQPSTSSSDDCESMTANPTGQAKNGQEGMVSATTPTVESPRAQHARVTPYTSQRGISQHQPNTTTTTQPRIPQHHGKKVTDKPHTSGTTTLTLYTTVPPIVQPSSSDSVLASSGFGGSQMASSQSLSGSAVPSASGNYAGSGQPSSSSAHASSSIAPSSSAVAPLSSSAAPSSASDYASTSGKPKHREPKSSPAVWGSLTLTYDATSNTGTTVITLVPSATTTQRTKRPQHTRVVETHAASSSAFPYPTPNDTPPQSNAQPSQVNSQPPSAIPTSPSSPPKAPSSTATQAQASSPAPQVTVPAPPQYQPSPPSGPPASNTPPIASQAAPSPPDAGPLSSTSTAALGGITIVPVNPDATTVYITVTTTDPGWTTTVAQQTVTAGGGWW